MAFEGFLVSVFVRICLNAAYKTSHVLSEVDATPPKHKTKRERPLGSSKKDRLGSKEGCKNILAHVVLDEVAPFLLLEAN